MASPYSVIGPKVEIGEGSWIGAHVVLDGRLRIGRNNKIFHFASLGAPPQDKKYAGEDTAVEQTGDSSLSVTGDLTIKDVTRPVTLDVEFDGFTPRDAFGKGRIAFTARTEIDREEFGITWNQALETGGVLVGKTVGIELQVQAVRPAEEPVA